MALRGGGAGAAGGGGAGAAAGEAATGPREAKIVPIAIIGAVAFNRKYL